MRVLVTVGCSVTMGVARVCCNLLDLVRQASGDGLGNEGGGLAEELDVVLRDGLVRAARLGSGQPCELAVLACGNDVRGRWCTNHRGACCLDSNWGDGSGLNSAGCLGRGALGSLASAGAVVVALILAAGDAGDRGLLIAGPVLVGGNCCDSRCRGSCRSAGYAGLHPVVGRGAAAQRTGASSCGALHDVVELELPNKSLVATQGVLGVAVEHEISRASLSIVRPAAALPEPCLLREGRLAQVINTHGALEDSGV